MTRKENVRKIIWLKYSRREGYRSGHYASTLSSVFLLMTSNTNTSHNTRAGMHSREISLPADDLPPPATFINTSPELVCTVVKSVFLLMTFPLQPPLPTHHTTPELVCTVVKSVVGVGVSKTNEAEV